jgi:hypothetical protein
MAIAVSATAPVFGAKYGQSVLGVWAVSTTTDNGVLSRCNRLIEQYFLQARKDNPKHFLQHFLYASQNSCYSVSFSNNCGLALA